MTAGFLALFGGLWLWQGQRTLGEDVRPIHQEAAASPQVAPQVASERKWEPVKEPDIIDKVVYRSIPEKGERFADLVIPKLDLRIPIVEGTGEKELKKGIGHYTDSVFPGEPDNAVLAGHRESRFRDIGRLKKGDRIIVETRDEGTFVFSVKKTWVTDKDDRTVIVSHDEPLLTLITCYPFHYIGSAPERYIVQAELKEILR